MKQLKITKFPALDYAGNEAFNTLSTNLSFAGASVKKIMITSCHAAEGKSYLSMNLMRTLAQRGMKVALVDADLRRSMVNTQYGLQFENGRNDDKGLSHFLAGMVGMEEVIYQTDIPNAIMVPVGRDVPNPLALLTNSHFAELLDMLARMADYVIVDAPPVGVVIDAAEIAKACDGTLIAVNYNDVSRQELLDVKQQPRSGKEMSGFTDYHAHFVYGVDDGAQTREEMYAMLDAAAADGVRHLFATSHSTPGMERFPQEVYDRHLALARAYCTQKGYDLKLEHGSELLYTPATGYAAVQRQLLTLGDTGWVLLEFVPNITAKELETALQEITGAGYRILVAHIERYPCLAQHGLLARLHEQYRLRCQINCSAVLDSGFWQWMRLEHWVKAGLVDAISSDAHNCTSRPTRMRQAYERLCTRVGQTTAQKLTGLDGTEYLV